MFKTDEERSKARFWQRFLTGAGLSDTLRFLTLNSSDESVVLGLDILDSFRKFLKRARRRYGDFEYFAVVGQAVDEPLRKHIHAICKGVYMDQRELEDMWVGVHKSIKPYIKMVKSIKSAANYLAKYLHQQSSNRYIMSAGWIFQGYVGWSNRYKKQEGHYPNMELIKEMANLNPKERAEVMGLYPDERKMFRDFERGIDLAIEKFLNGRSSFEEWRLGNDNSILEVVKPTVNS